MIKITHELLNYPGIIEDTKKAKNKKTKSNKKISK